MWRVSQLDSFEVSIITPSDNNQLHGSIVNMLVN